MRVIKDERQIKAEAWMLRLEEYVKEEKLPMRILDELEKCKSLMMSRQADWITVSRIIEELLESIEGKIVPAAAHKDDAAETVSVDEVKMQVRKMAQRCHTENSASVEGMAERKNAVIKKCMDNYQKSAVPKHIWMN